MVSYNKNKVMYDLSKFITEGGGGGGTSDHSKLENRSAANQHPITAITNLQESLASKQPTISDLSTIRSNATAGKSASDTIATYGDIVTHNAIEFALKSEIPPMPDVPTKLSELVNDTGFITEAYHDITKQDVIEDLDDYAKKSDIPSTDNFATKDEIPDVSNLATNARVDEVEGKIPSITGLAIDSAVVHKTGNETIGGVKTFNGGSGGNSVGIISLTGMLIGAVNKTAYTQYGTIRQCNNKAHTGSYYIYSDGSLFFRHKTGTKTAEGSINDAVLFLHPVNGLQAAWSGQENVDAGTPHDVLVDTINYSKLNTTTKDVLGAINELNSNMITEFKTINGETIIGEGNIEIQGGGGSTDWNDITNKPTFDGQWVNKASTLSTTLSAATRSANLKTNGYLPNDNNKYEIIVHVRTNNHNTSASNVTIKTDVITSDMRVGTSSTYNYYSAWVGIVPINATLTWTISNALSETFQISVYGYRRIGNNA